MSYSINPEHLLEDELEEEFSVRGIVGGGDSAWAKLLLNLASESSGVLPKPKALPTIRQASEMRSCANKLKDLSVGMQNAVRESDDSMFNILRSRYMHLQDRVNRLHVVAKNYDGMDNLVAEVADFGVFLAEADNSLGSPDALCGQDQAAEGAASVDQSGVLIQSLMPPVMTTSIQQSNVPPPPYSSVSFVPISTASSISRQQGFVSDFVANATRDSINFDLVSPPNSDTGIIATLQKQRQTVPSSSSISDSAANRSTGATNKNGAPQFQTTTGTSNHFPARNVPVLTSTFSTTRSTIPIVQNVANPYVFPSQVSHRSLQGLGAVNQSKSFSQPVRMPSAILPMHSHSNVFSYQVQDAHDITRVHQPRFEQNNANVFPQQQFFAYSSPESQSDDHGSSAHGAYLPRNVPPNFVPAPQFAQDRENPLLNNHVQAQGRPGHMYQMGKWNLKFQGTASDFPVDEFLFRIETLARSSNIAEDMLPFGMHYVLNGEAQNWYWVYHRDNPRVDWVTFKDAMRRHFSLIETQVEIREKISRRKQRAGETFNEFYLSVAGIAARLVHRMPEAELVEILRSNMIPQLKSALLFQPTDTVAQLQDCCKRCERLWQTESQLINRQSRPTLPSRVNEINMVQVDNVPMYETHPDSQLYYEQYQYGQVDQIDQIDALQKSEERKKIANRSDLMVCWNCEEMGHTFDVCTVATRNVFCYGCGLKNNYKPTCSRCKTGNLQRGGVNQGTLRPNPFAPNSILKR